MHKKLLLLLLIFSVTLANAQTWQDTAAMIDKIFSRYTDTIPGAQMAISRHGEIIYSSAKGMADLERKVPLTTTSRIEAGSVSKQFTAAAILLLEKEGKLSLNDDVHKYVPEVPNYGHTITIRHLMHHTSGLRDWGSIAEISGWPRGAKAYTNDDALHIITLQKTLNNKPGDEYIYSNSNYTLLTHIVQRVSGMSHAEFTKKYIFEPAGMTNTEWRDNYQRIVPHRAIAYSRSAGVYYINMPNENAYGHGGLLTTAEDLLKWNDYYLNGKLGSPSVLQKQLTTTALNSGRLNLYAAGLAVDSVSGWAAVSHSGATAGYRANLEYFPQLGLSFAWVSNNALSTLGDVPYSIRNILVKNKLPSENIGSTVAPNMNVQQFRPFLGAYRNTINGSGIRIYIKDTLLYSDPNGQLIPLTTNTATVGRARIFFSEKPRSFSMITGNNDTIKFIGVDTAQIALKNLQEYAGTYHSEETESRTTMLIKDGKLYAKVRTNEAPLVPVYKDGFSFPAGDIYFERDKQGKVNRFYISTSRARKVEFRKVGK